MKVQTKAKTVKKTWGHEEIIVNNEHYCGKLLYIYAGHQCSIHSHPVKHETFYVMKGIVRMEVEGKYILLKEGQSVIIPPDTQHRFGSVVNSILIEVSTPHNDEDVVRITESGAIPNATNTFRGGR
jgi:mannose-6-phosphate isomerase-like protein (cupin superfamily)